MLDFLGLPDALVVFLLAFLATLPIGLIHRILPGGPTVKHAYAFVTGFALCVASFGWFQSSLLLALALVCYGVMLASRRHAGQIVFFGAMSFLLACHIYFASGMKWAEGGLDVTGAMMVLTLKAIASAMNYSDGGVPEDVPMHDIFRKLALKRLPTLLEYLGFLFCCGTLLVGPVVEISSYLDFTNRKNNWAGNVPLPLWPIVQTLALAVAAGAGHIWLTNNLPNYYMLEDDFLKHSLLYRLWYVFMLSFTIRTKYYYAWSIAAAAMMTLGLGFEGYDKGVAQWSANVIPLRVELATSGVQLPIYWNISVGEWLRHYSYMRLYPPGKKPGFAPLAVTQFVSGIWHGVYPGYLLYFLSTALMIHASREIYRLQRQIKYVRLRQLTDIFHWLFTAIVHSNFTMGFWVLTFWGTIKAWQTTYFIAHWLCLAALIGCRIIAVVSSKGRQRRSKVTEDGVAAAVADADAKNGKKDK